MANDHQLFEDWLLSDTTLAPKEIQTLQEHLQTCSSCRQLSEAWQAVDYQLKSAPTVSPAPGFTDRWQTHLADDRLRRHRYQTIILLLFSVVVAAILIIASTWMVLPVFKYPKPLFLIWAYQYASLISSMLTFGDILTTVFRTLFGLVPPAIWATGALVLGSLGALWIIAINKLAIDRRMLT